MKCENGSRAWAPLIGERIGVWRPLPRSSGYGLHRGTQDLGTEDLDGRSPQEIWRNISSRTQGLGELADYSLFQGQQELSWNNLPSFDATFVRKLIAVGDRGADFKLVDRNQAPLPRKVASLVRVGCQLLIAERAMYGDQMEFDVPNEITLPQLVAHYIANDGRRLRCEHVIHMVFGDGRRQVQG
jgi:hypothetical protein